MSLQIYNSINQKKETFESLEPGKVRMYVCGITAYDECHLGHARAAVVFDVISRYLKHLGYEVTYVRNFTDVDDKIIKKSNETGESCEAISTRYIQSYEAQMQRLGVATPTEQPRATEHIAQMIQLVADLEKQGLAYKSGDDVFYRVRKFEGYGKLSHKKIDDLESGARIDVNEAKEDPLDFVLWKSAKPGEPKWDSPWGAGRPGWHLECSAMSVEYLGSTFDIHGGGRDLIFPHHENEIAQSEGASGQPFARYWIHNGFVNINAEKMSKSLGNIRSIPAILDQWDPEVVRYFLLSANYGSPLDFTDKAMEDAESSLTRIYETLLRFQEALTGSATLAIDLKPALEEGMNDDFNTPHVIGKVFEAIRELNRLLDEGKAFETTAKAQLMNDVAAVHNVLGIFGSNPAEFLERHKESKLAASQIDPSAIETLVQERIEARTDKDWGRSDAIRDELAAKGIVLKDNPDGTTTWSVKAG